MNFDEISDLVVDNQQPTTRLRIRFNNGSTETVVFNLSHKIVDIKNFISKKTKVHPKKFNLVVGNKPLEQEEDTLEKSGLKNCVVSQTMK